MSRRRLVAPLAVAAALLVGGAVTLTPNEGAAFCGFYVAGADAKLLSDATVVVLMRAGKRTVLSMQNDYQGPPEDFALVVPVPVILKEADVKILRPELFERVETLAAPRLVEYWEQDPCPEGTIGLGNTGLIGKGGGGGVGSGYGRGAGAGMSTVVVEAEFAVGEYEIAILSATESTGLDRWLRANGYRIPAGAEPLLRPYVAQGMKFFVAKVDRKKVKFDAQGRTRLSPLRFHYDSDEFSLPIRLGLINAPEPASGGKQDLLIHILAPEQRYEVANYPNITIPTNLDVTEEARGQFGAFYAALFDRSAAQKPGAVVTEYAWGASSCDPCPGPDAALTAKELAELGVDALDDPDLRPTVQLVPEVRMGKAAVKGELDPDIIRRIIRAHINEVRQCYRIGLAQDPQLAGRIELSFKIEGTGSVSAAAVGASALKDERVGVCMAAALRRWKFPKPRDGRAVDVTYPLDLASSTGSSFLGQASPFVLTRLHARYDARSLGEDLVFKAAAPIAGGRELWGVAGELEHGASPSSSNNFQGRYAIRHPWTGPIKCAEPIGGIWGGPPAGVQGGAAPVVAKRQALVAREAPLASLMTAESAALLKAEAPVEAPAEAPAEAADEAPAAVDEAVPEPAVAAERPPGCACAADEPRTPPAIASLLGLLGLLGLRARRRRAGAR